MIRRMECLTVWAGIALLGLSVYLLSLPEPVGLPNDHPRADVFYDTTPKTDGHFCPTCKRSLDRGDR